MMELNSRLKHLRIQNDLQASVLANMLGVSISTYCGWEADKTKKYYREPSLEKIKKLANYYNVSMDYITGYSELQKKDKQYVIDLVKKNDELKPYIKELVIDTFSAIV